jgi:hypothetical protein
MRGGILRELGDLGASASAFEDALLQASGDPDVIAKAELGLGCVALDRGHREEAQRRFLVALSLTEAERHAGGARQAHEALA